MVLHRVARTCTATDTVTAGWNLLRTFYIPLQGWENLAKKKDSPAKSFQHKDMVLPMVLPQTPHSHTIIFHRHLKERSIYMGRFTVAHNNTRPFYTQAAVARRGSVEIRPRPASTPPHRQWRVQPYMHLRSPFPRFYDFEIPCRCSTGRPFSQQASRQAAARA